MSQNKCSAKCLKEAHVKTRHLGEPVSYLICRAAGIFCSIVFSSESEWKKVTQIDARGMCCGTFCNLLIPQVYDDSEEYTVSDAKQQLA